LNLPGGASGTPLPEPRGPGNGASLPLDAICRPRDTPIWKLEAALKCRACKTPRYAPPVHMIRLTKERQIAPYAWVHPDDDR
jgi:hypothetical protein